MEEKEPADDVHTEKNDVNVTRPKRKPRTGKRKVATALNGNGRNAKLVIESAYGPAMSALIPLQQKFVEGLISSPQLHKTKILRAAGYDGTDDGCKQMVVRLMRNPIVLDAIQEVGRASLRGMVPDAVNSLRSIITDPKHRDHVKATLALMDRTGLHAVSESHQTVVHTFDRTAVIAKIATILERNAGLIPAPTAQPINVVDAVIVEPDPEAIETD